MLTSLNHTEFSFHKDSPPLFVVRWNLNMCEDCCNSRHLIGSAECEDYWMSVEEGKQSTNKHVFYVFQVVLAYNKSKH
ncbi:hypothetical protein RB195_011381 [Necator americanus]|uniref:Uncharacterized protein n=1 Tax=Necator americanus TaxID=51031 RepID=A0ABR1D297_NECAM